MTRALARLVPVIAVAALALAGCTDPPGAAPLRNTSWTLRPGSLDVPIPQGRTINANFSATEISGIAACNSYRASYTAGPGGQLDIGDIVTTRIACPEPILRAEQAYIAELRQVTSYRLDGGSLRLGNGTEDLLHFTRTPPPATTTTVTRPPTTVAPGGPAGSWTVTRYMNAGDGLSSPLPGTTITLTFDRDGNVGGRACNSYGGSWTVSGSSITIGNLFHTEMYCTTPAGVMQQEDDYFTALRAARTWRIEGDRLVLSHPRGTSVIAERAT